MGKARKVHVAQSALTRIQLFSSTKFIAKQNARTRVAQHVNTTGPQHARARIILHGHFARQKTNRTITKRKMCRMRARDMTRSPVDSSSNETFFQLCVASRRGHKTATEHQQQQQQLVASQRNVARTAQIATTQGARSTT